jgi:hypothetical protein
LCFHPESGNDDVAVITGEFFFCKNVVDVTHGLLLSFIADSLLVPFPRGVYPERIAFIAGSSLRSE